MVKVRKITDANNEVIYPITHTKAIVDDSGNVLDNTLKTHVTKADLKRYTPTERLARINGARIDGAGNIIITAGDSDITTVDSYPTEGSTNPVQSDGVARAIGEMKEDLYLKDSPHQLTSFSWNVGNISINTGAISSGTNQYTDKIPVFHETRLGVYNYNDSYGLTCYLYTEDDTFLTYFALDANQEKTYTPSSNTAYVRLCAWTSSGSVPVPEDGAITFEDGLLELGDNFKYGTFGSGQTLGDTNIVNGLNGGANDVLSAAVGASVDARLRYLEANSSGSGSGSSSPNLVLDGSVDFKTQVNNISNRVIEIRNDFDLNNEEVTLGENVTLYFAGNAILSNGNIIGNNTAVLASHAKHFDDIYFTGTWEGLCYPELFGADGSTEDDAIGINDCISALSRINSDSINRAIELEPGKVYHTKTAINLPYLNENKVSVNGNGATIKVTGTQQSIISVGFDKPSGAARTGPNNPACYIKDLSFSGAGQSTYYAVLIKPGFQNFKLLNCNIWNVLNGLFAQRSSDSSDIQVDNCFISGVSSDLDGTGVYYGGPDNYVSNTRIYKFRRGIYGYGFIKVTSTHVLCFENATNYTDTVFLEATEIAIISGSYCDSQYTFVKGGKEIIVSDCYAYSWIGKPQKFFSNVASTKLKVVGNIFAVRNDSIGIPTDEGEITGSWIVKDNFIRNGAGFTNQNDPLLIGTRGGTSKFRPITSEIGYNYFDTTLGKPIWWNGTGWVDVNGIAV